MEIKKGLLNEKVSVGEAIIRVLEEVGIDLIFGIQGGDTRYIFDALYDHRSSIRTILVRHESLAGIMAEVYGRLTGRPGVALGQGAFMLANALLGVLEAHLGSSPMLLLCDLSDNAPFSQHGPYQAGTGDYGTWNARQSFGGVTKLTLVPQEPVQAVQSTQIAIKHSLSGEQGPVAVLYHSGSLNGHVGPSSEPRLYSTNLYLGDKIRGADSNSIQTAARMLYRAKRPVIIAGNGVRNAGAYSQLQSLAEKLGAPVATTASGKGVFAETHELALGVFGTFGLPLANAVVNDGDTILVVGSKLSPSDTAKESLELINPLLQTLIQVDIEPKNAGWTFPCEHVVIGDASAVLMQLLEAIQDMGDMSVEVLFSRRERLAEFKRKYGFFDLAEYRSTDIPILPQRIISELQNTVAEDALITCDAGENRLFMLHFYQCKSAGSLIMPASTGGMGYAIPAALSAKLIYQNRQILAVCGDGGFAMAMNGLITAYEEKIPIVTVVFNNSVLGWVRHGQQGRTIASKFSDINYARIAQDIGCFGIRVGDPRNLKAALEEALKHNGPAVVDVVTAFKPSYKDILSPLVRS